MGITLKSWLIWPALIFSIVFWFGISTVTADAIHVLVKSNFDVGRPFGSVSTTTLVVAFVWLITVSFWLKKTSLVSIKRTVLQACVVAVWAVVLTVLTAIGVDSLWYLRWTVVVIPIAFWIVEVVGALWLLRVLSPPSFWGQGVLRMTTIAIAALTWLMGAKALWLALSPGVVIRM